MVDVVWLVSARAGDIVPGVEISDPDCPEIPGLLDRPDVREFMKENNYGLGDPDELVYLIRDEDTELPPGLPALRVDLLPSWERELLDAHAAETDPQPVAIRKCRDCGARAYKTLWVKCAPRAEWEVFAHYCGRCASATRPFSSLPYRHRMHSGTADLPPRD
jgi:hypothetical protein